LEIAERENHIGGKTTLPIEFEEEGKREFGEKP